jgi:hypothetical protein
MRTTLTIDDDVLQAARALAAQWRKNVGEVISDLARQALQHGGQCADMRNGVPLLPARARASPVTLERVNGLRDELPR